MAAPQSEKMLFLIGIFVASPFLMVFSVPPSPSHGNEPKVYYGVQDGCQLIQCTNGTSCGIRNLTVKMGAGPFINYLYPKCISSPADLNQDTGNDGNAHTEVNGPGCGMVQCSEGYQCQVRISIVKLGNMPYAQSIGSFPSCVNATDPEGDSDSSSSNGGEPGGPGCDLIGSCPSGHECVSLTGIGKVGLMPWAQYFFPTCVANN